MNPEGKWSGTVIQSDRGPEPIVLKLVEDYGEYVQIVGAYLTTLTHVEVILSKEEVNPEQLEQFFAKLIVKMTAKPFNEERDKIQKDLDTKLQK